ncbi:MAG: type II secretion system protein GspE, partial [Candidatus Omnitrophica bacterium]|nr:type II secretion system protein GspE [Candidatus Omnitrophota bacterium]
MAQKPQAIHRLPLGRLLVERGMITMEELEEALTEQRRTGEFLGSILTRLGKLAREQLLPILAEQLEVPFVRLGDMQMMPEALAKVPP